MDTIKNAIGLGDNQNNEESSSKKEEGNFFTRIGDKINAMAGGGPESEKKEDLLDKSIDFVQEHILKQGPQDNESAIEQAKDEAISDFIRAQYKSYTGKEFPIKDKD